jgi:malate dehydrogenase
MIDVAIIGAGELGGSLAHVLARREIVRRIQLIDPSGQVAAGKALDIMQTGPVERFTTPVQGSTDLSRVAGCAVVIVADQFKPQPDADALLILTQLKELASRAVILCAGLDGRVLVERGVRELKYARARLIGSAPEALSSALRAVVALQVNGSVRDVALTVMGAPPSHAFVSWDDATIAGCAATRVLDEPTRRKLSSQIGPLWPPGPHALAHAATDAVSAMCGVSRRALSCFVAPDDAMGQRARAVALPVRLCATGLESVATPTLSGVAKTALDNAMLL